MISFVVPAHNEERLLGPTLSALSAAAREVGEPCEIMVADDGSTDRTAEVARAHGARVIPIRFRQIARARNAGARDAAGDPLIFVDADTLVSAGTLRATISVLAAGACGGGARVEFDGRLPFYAWVLLPILRLVMRRARLGAGCYLFCSRSAFDAVGGFDERLFASEEIAFSRALKRRGRFVILPQSVLTSGRRLRAHTGWTFMRFVARVMFRGPAALHDRELLDAWYGERRDDPEPGPPEVHGDARRES